MARQHCSPPQQLHLSEPWTMSFFREKKSFFVTRPGGSSLFRLANEGACPTGSSGWGARKVAPPSPRQAAPSVAVSAFAPLTRVSPLPPPAVPPVPAQRGRMGHDNVWNSHPKTYGQCTHIWCAPRRRCGGARLVEENCCLAHHLPSGWKEGGRAAQPAGPPSPFWRPHPPSAP